MKTFKLIKWYPSLPEDWKGREIVAKQLESGNYSYQVSESLTCIIRPCVVENNPEFWEEVKEKEWEILEFETIESGKLITLRKNGRYLTEGTTDEDLPLRMVDGDGMGATLEEMLDPRTHVLISKVKRLSDGEVFEVGDMIKYGDGVESYIKGIKINKIGNCRLVTDFKSVFSIRNVTKVAMIEYFFVDTKNWSTWNTYFAEHLQGEEGTIKVFNSEDERAKFISANKKEYTRNELLDFANYVTCRRTDSSLVARWLKNREK